MITAMRLISMRLTALKFRFAEPTPDAIDMLVDLRNEHVDVIRVKIKDERPMEEHLKNSRFAAKLSIER